MFRLVLFVCGFNWKPKENPPILGTPKSRNGSEDYKPQSDSRGRRHLLAADADAQVCPRDHRHVVGTVTDGKRDGPAVLPHLPNKPKPKAKC